jgi:hypothetical protein
VRPGRPALDLGRDRGFGLLPGQGPKPPHNLEGFSQTVLLFQYPGIHHVAVGHEGLGGVRGLGVPNGPGPVFRRIEMTLISLGERQTLKAHGPHRGVAEFGGDGQQLPHPVQHAGPVAEGDGGGLLHHAQEDLGPA